jgi:hypothetical protein
MTNERFFRLLSIALLGAAALAFVPDIKADESEQVALLQSMQELQTLGEIDQINSGNFQPWLRDTGDTAALDVSTVTTPEMPQ